ncbi:MULTISPECIES: hypothetical protein [unclassified Bradyrhizobium]|uniref:hypothetical protein n=1 Tax=unclassified Bradyrhizobium TaxID=2631580 RepID=UPI002915D39B|nr:MULTISPECIES: hypothetical protein [unclassified Bradyrhizobium]
MTTIRLIPHDASFEVRYGDGRPSIYFYFDDANPLRRQMQGIGTRDQALDQARTFARQERDGVPPRLMAARQLVAAWKTAHNLPYLSPRVAEDLARRIEQALTDQTKAGS